MLPPLLRTHDYMPLVLHIYVYIRIIFFRFSRIPFGDQVDWESRLKKSPRAEPSASKPAPIPSDVRRSPQVPQNFEFSDLFDCFHLFLILL